MGFFRKKDLNELTQETKDVRLKKTLNAWDLTLIGLGGIIGVGIFVLSGKVAALAAGPAITLSFILAGVICISTALIYGELAAAIPVAGGAYTFSYVVLGEVFAWLIGFCSILVCTLGSSMVAAGWAGYLAGGLASKGLELPAFLGRIPAEGGFVNLPAVIITVCITYMLYRGTKESAKLNGILVLVKILVIGIFFAAAFPHFDPSNVKEFMPYGIGGVITGAASVFMAFAGFEQVASAAEETKNPKRDLPLAIIGSVAISTVIYVLITGMLTGIVDYRSLNNAEPMAFALRENGIGIGSLLVTIGALGGMPAVILANIYSQSRIVFAMSRDGILPSIFSKLHRKNGTPYISLLLSGLLVSLISGFLPIETIAFILNVALLTVFATVSLSAMLLRYKRPDLRRPFKCPAIYVIGSISFLSALYLVADLLSSNINVAYGFSTCIAFALISYICYGRKNSVLNPASLRHSK